MLPGRDRPVRCRKSRRRGQHEHGRPFMPHLTTNADPSCRFAEPEPCRSLACEGERARLQPLYLVPEALHIERLAGDLRIDAPARLAEIRQPHAEVQQQRILMRCKQARRDTRLMQRAPEPIARVRILGANRRRHRPRRRAHEPDAQIRRETVRQDMGRRRSPARHQLVSPMLPPRRTLSGSVANCSGVSSSSGTR